MELSLDVALSARPQELAFKFQNMVYPAQKSAWFKGNFGLTCMMTLKEIFQNWITCKVYCKTIYISIAIEGQPCTAEFGHHQPRPQVQASYQTLKLGFYWENPNKKYLGILWTAFTTFL